MLIVEGPDNAGKTTLVQQLLELDPSLRILHRDRFKPGENIAISYINALLPKDGDRVAHGNGIADRLLASECIYGDLFRNGCRMTEGEHLAVRNVLNAYGAIAVHCDASDETIMASWAKREQLYDDPLIIARAYRERFDAIFATSDRMRYDWTDAEIGLKLRQQLIGLHAAKREELKRGLSWWSVMSHGVGKLIYPKVIIIGEAPSPQAKTPIPFANGPAGNFLAWALNCVAEELPLVLNELYITNADKGSYINATLLREELTFLIGPQTVVLALGREAEQLYEQVMPSLTKPPIAFSAIPHPQFWRRFHWNKRNRYVEYLHRAIVPAFGRIA